MRRCGLRDDQWDRTLISALQVDSAIFFSATITVAAFVPLFTMQGVEGQIFGPMARTYGYALVGALIATFTVTPVLASLLLPEHVREAETIVVRALRAIYSPALRLALANRRITVAFGLAALAGTALLSTRLGGEFLPALEEGNFWIRATMPPSMGLEAGTAAVGKMGSLHESALSVRQVGRMKNVTLLCRHPTAQRQAFPAAPVEQVQVGQSICC
jgi:cobalt-zinc-cadmium resistance protein CzcA